MRINWEKLQTTKLTKILKENRVILAYLFGSQSRETAGPMSDIDISILFSKTVPSNEYFKRELVLANDISLVFGIDKIDIINLATISNPLLRYNAVFNGKLIFSQDKKSRFTLERKVMQEYEDTEHLRTVQRYYLYKHIKEGTFGKAPLSPKQEKLITLYVHR